MLLLLLLCLHSSSAKHTAQHPAPITAPAEGNVSVTCDPVTGRLPAVRLRLLLEENNTDSWVMLQVSSDLLWLDTRKHLLLLPGHAGGDRSNYSCSVDNRSRQAHTGVRPGLERVKFDPGAHTPIYCNVSSNWSSLCWTKDGHILAVVTRGKQQLDLLVNRNEPSISITSIFSRDNCSDSSEGPIERKTMLLTCNAETGFQTFMEEKYWVIVVSALSYVLFCLLASGCYIYIRHKWKAEKQRKEKARFFKVSTNRNLYVESFKEESVTQKEEEFTYQNFCSAKEPAAECFSNNSSFLDPSEDGGSYLEPMEGEDGEPVSEDDVCYENANEELKAGSEGSQSYEDMNGSRCLKAENFLNVEKIREEDADSYVNMEAPVYSHPHRSLEALNVPTDEMSAPEPQTWPISTLLRQENGDFYLSYQPSNV